MKPWTEAGRRLLEGNFFITEWTDARQRVAADLTAPQFVAAILAIETEARDDLLDDPRFRAAVDEVFAAPGDFGPAKGYYGPDTDHFIEMLRAALGRVPRRVPGTPPEPGSKHETG